MNSFVPSFRARILLLVLTVAVVPNALLGLWLTRSAPRSVQEWLTGELDETLDRTVARIGSNWLKQRSDLLFLGDHDDVQRTLLAESSRAAPDGSAAAAAGPVPAGLRELFDDLDPAVTAVTIRDRLGNDLWTLRRAALEPSERTTAEQPLRVRLQIYQRFPARELGTLEADIALERLLGAGGLATSLPGVVLGAFDAERDAPLLPLPFDPQLLDQAAFVWGGIDEEWLTARRRMTDPPLVLVAAAPLSPFAGPFDAAARRGTWLLAMVALGGLLAAWLLTGRLTRSLHRLVTAAEAVSHGDLEANVGDPGADEVGRVAHAFNTMTSSLRNTLAELADRERLAAVGEFAASLAHEVRNPLTAIRIDLQRVEERLPPDSPLREPQARALREIGRLDQTVSETLDVARTGKWRGTLVDLAIPLRAAADAAAPAFAEREAVLDLSALDGRVPTIRGDAAALEQLFLNLILNAAGALGPGGRAWIEVDEAADRAVVAIRDTGTGIEPEMLERVFQPLYTTRPDGTGLGLTVARRIVDQHKGSIEIDSEVGEGTTVRVRLPLQRGSATAGVGHAL
jgi:signal transduction histidine kinase